MFKNVLKLSSFIGIALIALVVMMLLVALPYHIFPSDMEMEKNFSENKKDFENLILLVQKEKRTRLTDEPDYKMHQDKDAIDLMARLNVSRAKASQLWLYNPYSNDHAARASNAMMLASASENYAVRIEPVNGSSIDIFWGV